VRILKALLFYQPTALDMINKRGGHNIFLLLSDN